MVPMRSGLYYKGFQSTNKTKFPCAEGDDQLRPFRQRLLRDHAFWRRCVYCPTLKCWHISSRAFPQFKLPPVLSV